MQSKELWKILGTAVCGVGTAAYIIGMSGAVAVSYREDSQKDIRPHLFQTERRATSQEIASFYRKERSIKTADSVAEFLTDAGAAAMAAGFLIGLFGHSRRQEEDYEDYEDFQLPANEEHRNPTKRR
jgi:hypothetical protein